VMMKGGVVRWRSQEEVLYTLDCCFEVLPHVSSSSFFFYENHLIHTRSCYSAQAPIKASLLRERTFEQARRCL